MNKKSNGKSRLKLFGNGTPVMNIDWWKFE